MAKVLRSALIVGAVIFAIAVPSLQAIYQFGLSAAAFSFQGDDILRVAGYAFAIWGLLYLGMIGYGVYQALPVAWSSPIVAIYAWPSAIAIAGCGLWILMAALNWTWMTVLVISLSALGLMMAIVQAKGAGSVRDKLLVALPLNLLAGWLTIASIVNLVTVLTIERIVTSDQATMIGYAAVGGATFIAAIVAVFGRSAFYLAPIIWGLLGVRAAESVRHSSIADAAGLAVLALGALALALLALWVFRAMGSKPVGDKASGKKAAL
ncbi:hypothetical protein [Candidatus Viadribacter manganicus]|nr:hypothetical protein [Candidatus Viadribacter manganicus]